MARRDALVLTALALSAAVLAHGEPQGSDFCRVGAFGDSRAAAEAYARRTGGYCDGAVFEPHAGSGELPVIGVSAAPIAGNPQLQPVRIQTMALPAAVGGVVWPLHLQGVARSPKVNYRLDAALSASRPLVVGPESAMLKVRPSLSAEEVAWMAWSDTSQDGRTYVPLQMPGAASRGVELTVRPTIPVAYLLFSIEDPGGKVLQRQTSLRFANDPAKRAAPIPLLIPAGMPQLVVVKVAAVGNSGATQVADVRLVRPAGGTQ
jgi:hypothetical protein